MLSFFLIGINFMQGLFLIGIHSMTYLESWAI